MTEDATESVSVGRIEVGDVVSIPGTSIHRCRVRLLRSAVPGVVWLYLADATGAKLPRHVALPVDHDILRHATTPAIDPAQLPEDG